MPTIAARLRKEIESRDDITYSEVASRIGISRAAMSDICSGKTKQPKPENLLKIADVLGLELRWLISGKGTQYTRDLKRDTLDLSELSPSDRARLHSILDAFKKPDDQGPSSTAGGSA